MIKNVLEYLEIASERTPDKVVAGDQQEELTYHRFVNMAKSIGSSLARSGNYREPIGVLIDRNVYSILGFMGIVYAGCMYVPIDKNLPRERIEKILTVIRPKALLVLEKDLEEARKLNFSVDLLKIEEMAKHSADEKRLSEIRNKHLDTDPLYIMFTSGSTGVPKGVVISHRSVIDLTEQFQGVFGFCGEDVFANQAPFDFDVSVKDWYLTIKNGGTMQIVPKSMFVMPKGLSAYLNERKVSVLIWAASALGVVAGFRTFQKEKPEFLRKVMFSGEVLPMKVLHYWQQNLPQVQYVNLYGPTEITCNCTYYIVDREFARDEVLPIGRAFPNTEILLLNGEEEAALGKVGEICVRGTSLALGYYSARQVSEEVFCQNPLQKNYRELIYRTGDLGWYNESGELVFASRKDSQIKHMGHRIELGEIEACANGLEIIEKCCCLYDKEKSKILLVYQALKQRDKDVIMGIQEKLPKYMCPNRLIYLEKIPMNAHDKMDRVKLQKMYLHGSMSDKGGSRGE